MRGDQKNQLQCSISLAQAFRIKRQVTAELLGERLAARVWAKRYAPGGHTWAKHLADALDAGNPLHALLGAGGTQQYDYVIFQVLSTSPCG